AREEREYALADRIIVLSSFAHGTFISEGVSAEKLGLIPLGADLQRLRPAPEVVRARQQRLLGCGPLRVLYVGAMSFQNGLWVVPIRDPDALVERLRWCSDHRDEVAAMVGRIYEHFQPRDWSEVAADFEAACLETLPARSP